MPEYKGIVDHGRLSSRLSLYTSLLALDLKSAKHVSESGGISGSTERLLIILDIHL